LAFAAPVLDGPKLASGQVTPPTFALGNLLLENLNKTVGVSALHFTGLDCLTGLLILVAVLRRAMGSRVDRMGQTQTAWPLPHAGSVVVASAFAIVLASLWEGEIPGWSPRAWFTLLVLAAGMVANNRRLVWVEVIGIVVTYALISRRTRFERNLIRILILSLPLLVPYCLMGWNSDAPAFKPVKIIRSVTDSDRDGSSTWRDLENWNLVFTVADHPVLGSGFGHE